MLKKKSPETGAEKEMRKETQEERGGDVVKLLNQEIMGDDALWQALPVYSAAELKNNITRSPGALIGEISCRYR